jgi:hypothetical protein
MSEYKDNKSTGPRTPEGKARSAKNAIKHGFRSQAAFVPKGMEDQFDNLQSSLRAEIKPVGQLEEVSFRALLKAAWDMQRLQDKLADPSGDGSDPFEEPYNYAYDHFLHYYKVSETSYHRHLRELRTLQAARVLQQAIPKPLGIGTFPRLLHPGQIISITKRTDQYAPLQSTSTPASVSPDPNIEVFDPDIPKAA